MEKARKFILLLGDILLAYFALLITLIIRFYQSFNWNIFWKHFWPFSFLYLIWLIVLYIFGLYDFISIRKNIELFPRLGEAVAINLFIGAFFFYFVPFFGIYPKINLLIDIIVFTLFIFLWRRFFCNISSLYHQNVAFLGKNYLVDNLIKKFESQPHLGYKFIGFLDNKKHLLRQIKSKKVDILVIAENLTDKLIEELYISLPLKITIIDISNFYESVFKKIPINFIDQQWFLKNLKEGEKKVYDKIKRFEDIIFGTIILLLTIPFWIIFPILIKAEDKGTVFYKQKRVGKNNKVFWLWKFRSMRPDSEKRGAQWAKKEDDRITKIGKFLRRSHLDEIPQMINVIKGDISLVGPRPERPPFVKKLEKEIPYYNLRHIIKSGFTGWAQINFRYARSIEDSHEKFQYDLYYIKNRSFSLDLACLLKTFQIFFRKNYF